MKYSRAILGGTFDHFHAGHKHLLDVAFANAEKVDIGLTPPEMYQKKVLSQVIESYETREASLTNYFQQEGTSDRAKIIRLKDIYGESLEERDIDAIFVTEVTYQNALVINEERKKLGFAELVIEKVDFVKGSDGEIITSERIRRGEIDREGNPYKAFFTEDLTLPEELREELHHPIGEIITDIQTLQPRLSKYHTVITVGDVISKSLIDAGFEPSIMIIDEKTRREAIVQHLTLEDAKRVMNQAGFVMSDAVTIYSSLLNKWIRDREYASILVEGEEDLLALPAILLAPLGSVVLYGQYGQGIVFNEVTEEMKEKVLELVKKFS